MRAEGRGKSQTKRKYINDVLQDNHSEGKWNKGPRKSTKVNESQRKSTTTSWVQYPSTLKCLAKDKRRQTSLTEWRHAPPPLSYCASHHVMGRHPPSFRHPLIVYDPV